MLRSFQRSYASDLVAPLEPLPKGFVRHDIGSVRFPQAEYALYGYETEAEAGGFRKPHVLITGGVHGDEPAGALTAVRFLREKAPGWAGRYRLTIIPCVNPSGYEIADRCNLDGVDLNRNFKDDTLIQENRAIQGYLLARCNGKFRATVDLHEVFPTLRFPGIPPQDFPLGYFLWENCEERRRRVGPKIIREARKVVPVCAWPKILGDSSVDGVVSYPEGATGTLYAGAPTMDAYLATTLTDHAFTFEAPAVYPLEDRIMAHLMALDAMLANLK